jgi:hypothetical protein
MVLNDNVVGNMGESTYRYATSSVTLANFEVAFLKIV